MPIELQHVFNQAAQLSDNEQLHVNREGDLAQGTELSAFQRLSKNAVSAENRTAAQSFLRALESHPSYREVVSEVRAPLDKLIESGKPLTASLVNQTKLALNIELGIRAGRALVASGALPEGHSTAFGQFAAARGISTDTPEGVARALQEYVTNEIVPRNAEALTRLPVAEDKAGAVGLALEKIAGPAAGPEGFFAKLMDGVDPSTFSFDALKTAWADSHAREVGVLKDFSPEALNFLDHCDDAPQVFSLLEEALLLVGTENVDNLCSEILNRAPELSNPTERAAFMTDFMLNLGGSKAARSALAEAGLPASFASAIGHNPEVVKNAKAALGGRASLEAIPTKGEVAEALAKAAGDFVTKESGRLAEIAWMAANPPAELAQVLTAENVPQLVNALLVVNDFIAPIISDEGAIGGDFAEKALAFSEAIDSATHSFRGDFGTDDAVKVLSATLKTALVMNGIGADEFPAVAIRAMSKFAPLASEISSISGKLQTQMARGGDLSVGNLRDSMALYRMLEHTSISLIGLLTDDERSALQWGAFNADANGRLTRAQRENVGKFLEMFFQKSIPEDSMSQTARAFAEARGIELEPLKASIAENPEEAAFSKLEAENRRMLDGMMAIYMPEGSANDLVPPVSAHFIDLFGRAAQHSDLSRIDPNTVVLTSMSKSIHDKLGELAQEATKAGNHLESKAAAAVIEEMLLHELETLQSTLVALDALDGATAAEKALMGRLAARTGIRDAGIISDLAAGAKKADNVFIALSAPDATPEQIADGMLDLSRQFTDVRLKMPEIFRSYDEAPAFFCAYGLQAAGLAEADFENLQNNLESDAAHDAAAVFSWVKSESTNVDSANRASVAYGMMEVMREEAHVARTGNAGRDPMFFASRVLSHPSELAPGIAGASRQLVRMSGGELNDVDLALSKTVPGYSESEWDALKQIIEHYQDDAKGVQYGFLLPSWIAASGKEILALAEKHGGMPTLNDLWTGLTGGAAGKLPRSIAKSENAGELVKHVVGRYLALLAASNPDVSPRAVDLMLPSIASMQIPLAKAFELTKPGTGVTLADFRGDSTLLSSLRGYDRTNAYGLVTDFARQNPSSTLTFTKANGESFTVKPRSIPHEENTPENPLFKEIVGFWGGMTHSDAQLRRLGQSFSQASLIFPRIVSGAFPGQIYSEHGGFNMSAVELEDGSIRMTVRSPEDLPLQLNEEFLIKPDGTHECTRFDMWRPRTTR